MLVARPAERYQSSLSGLVQEPSCQVSPAGQAAADLWGRQAEDHQAEALEVSARESDLLALAVPHSGDQGLALQAGESLASPGGQLALPALLLRQPLLPLLLQPHLEPRQVGLSLQLVQ